MSSDYHDYVFKNGEFIGDFEGMYRNCEDPWRTDEKFFKSSEYGAVLGLLQYCRWNSKDDPFRILECGSGKGNLTRFLSYLGETVGVEVSSAAIEIARQRVPEASYYHGDIRHARPEAMTGGRGSFSTVLMYRFIWYVIDRLDDVLETCRALLSPAGHLLIECNFYRGDYYGKDIIGSPGDLCRLVEKRFRVLKRYDYYDIEQDPSFQESTMLLCEKREDLEGVREKD